MHDVDPTSDARVPADSAVGAPAGSDVAAAADQLAFDPLPTMADLDALHVDLDEIDRVLSDLDDERPDRRVNESEAAPRA